MIVPHSPIFSDFRVYYAAAWVGTHYGWTHIYDGRLAAAAPVPGLYPFANPPILAWLAAPLTTLPYSQAQPIWTVALALVTVAGAASLGTDTKSRLLGAGLVLATLPAVVTMAFGQSVAICFAAVAAARVLEQRGRPAAAGAVLSLALLKPQTVLLVPLQLLLARRFRTFGALAVCGALLAAVSVASVGPSGVGQWLDQVRAADQFPGMRQWGLNTLLPGAIAWAIRLGAVVAAGVVAHRTKRSDLALITGVLGSVLISPYDSAADFLMVSYCIAWILLAAPSIAPHAVTPVRLVAGAGWVVTSVMTMTPGLMPAVEAILLLTLVVVTARRTGPATAPGPLAAAEVSAEDSYT